MADNATRLKILASVEGIQGFDNLKRSLQGLAQQSAATHQDLFKLNAAYEKLRRGSDGSINSMRLQVQALTQLRESVGTGTVMFGRYTAQLDEVRAKLDAVTRAEKNVSNQQQRGGPAGAGLIGGLAARVAAPLATVAGAGAITAAGFDAEASQVRLKALTDQFGEYNQAQQAAATIASTLRLSTAEAEGQFATFYGTLRPAGISIRELEDAMIGFGAAARNSGATAQETAGAIIQLKQALASGVLQGEELRALREQMPLVTQQIAKEMGISLGELKKAGEEGRITTEIMLKALSKLRDTQLGTLQLQFNTAQQAVTDLGNAFKDTSAELFKLFGPTAILGLRSLTDAIRGVGNELKIIENSRAGRSVSATAQALSKIGLPLQQISGLVAGIGTQITSLFANPAVTAALKIIQTAYANETAGGRKLTAAGVPLTFKDDTGNVYDTASGRFLRNEKPALSREAIADAQAAADENRRRSAAAVGKGKEKKFQPSSRAQALINAAKKLGVSPLDLATLISFETGGSFSPGIVGGEGGRYQGLIQFGPTERAQYGMNRGQTFEEQIQGPVVRYFQDRFKQVGMSTQGADLLRLYTTVLAGSPRANPNARDSFGTSARSGVAAMGPHRQRALQMFFGGNMENVGYSMAEAGQDLAQGYEEMQRLAEQRQKDQQDYSKKQQEEADQNQSIYNQLQARLQVSKAITEEEKIRAEYGVKINDLETQLTEEISNMVDPAQILIREELRRNEIYQTRIDMLQEIADLQVKQQSEQISAQWQDQQVTLAATLSDYYSQQSEQLQEQNQYAESLAQTIGQGMQQAFSLAIQGAENLGESLRQLGATVLKDIAQQLIQIAVIAPVIKAISNIGGGGGIAPISPGINALPGGDFSQFFAPAAGSFAAGLPSAAITPFQGGNPFSFATGRIMTPQGPVPLRTYARGGIATAPQAAIYGEGSTPEAFIPLPDGRRVPVALKQYPGIPGAPGNGQFESTDQVVQRLVETARQESTARAAAVAASSPDGTVRIKVETTRINSVDYVTAEQAEALAQAAATRSTARQQRALQSSPGARRSLGI